MPQICRLCGSEKSSDELVISLQKEIGIITFKEFIEFYCRITLDSDPDLPQTVCISCRNSLSQFSEFSYLVEQQQLKLGKKEIKVPVKQKADVHLTNRASSEYGSFENGGISSNSSFVDENEPSEKRAKLDKSANEMSLLDEVLPMIEEDKDKPTKKRALSVFNPFPTMVNKSETLNDAGRQINIYCYRYWEKL